MEDSPKSSRLNESIQKEEGKGNEGNSPAGPVSSSPNSRVSRSPSSTESKSPVRSIKKDQVNSPRPSLIKKLASFMKSPLKKTPTPSDTSSQASEINGSAAKQDGDPGQDPPVQEMSQPVTLPNPDQMSFVTNPPLSDNSQDPVQKHDIGMEQPVASAPIPALSTPAKENSKSFSISDCSGITGCFGVTRKWSPPYGKSPNEALSSEQRISSSNIKSNQNGSSPDVPNNAGALIQEVVERDAEETKGIADDGLHEDRCQSDAATTGGE